MHVKYLIKYKGYVHVKACMLHMCIIHASKLPMTLISLAKADYLANNDGRKDS